LTTKVQPETRTNCQSKPKREPNHISMMVLGDNKSGKTALIKRFVYDKFVQEKNCDDYTMETGKRQYKRDLKVEDKTKITEGFISLSIDEQGYQSEYKSMNNHAIYEALSNNEHQVYIICFRVDSQESLKSAKETRTMIERHGEDLETEFNVVLAATFCDEDKTRTPATNQLECVRTSAKSGLNVDLLFMEAVAQQLGIDKNAVEKLNSCLPEPTPNPFRDSDSDDTVVTPHLLNPKWTMCPSSPAPPSPNVYQERVRVRNALSQNPRAC